MNKIKKRGTPILYDNSFKLAIAREYLTTDIDSVRLGAKYDLPATRVKFFVSWYRKKYPDGMVPQESALPQPADNDKALKEANLKIAALEMLIENAGKELGVDLVKKSGTKQSGK